MVCTEGIPIEPIERGVFRIPMALPDSLECDRKLLEEEFARAQRRLVIFASGHGWHRHIEGCFAERAEIYDTQEGLIGALERVTGMDAAGRLPAAFSAALENGVFMSVSPEVYAEIFPEGVEPRSFEKLIAHEMAHRLHIRILGGNEAAMGPVWFYEGFAIYAAGQLEHAVVDPGEIKEIVVRTERGNYLKYSAVIRHFLRRSSLPELVDRAGKIDFIDWLMRI